MKLAHIADVHLDASFVQLSASVARGRRQAIRDALRRALDRAREEGAEALLVAGDLYEHDRATPDTGNFLREAFGALAPMRVLIAPGNHDWFGAKSLYHLVDWSDNVHVFTEDELTPLELTDGLTIWGGAHRAPAGTGGFLDSFETNGEGVNLALFHGSERGEFQFQEEGKQLHAPFEDTMVPGAGLHHAFVGHYHTPLDAEWHTYPGSLEPLTFGATPAGGIVLAEVTADGSVEREHVIVTSTHVWDERIDISGSSNAHAVLELVRDRFAGMSGIARVTLTGSLNPDVDLTPEDVERACDWLDAMVVRVDGLQPAYDLDAILREQTVRGQFVRDVQDAALRDDLKQRVVATGLRALEGRDDLEVPV